MRPIRNLFFSLPIQMALLIMVAVVGTDYLPLMAREGAYAISLTLKEILMAVLPFIVFSSVFGAFARLPKGAVALVFILLFCIVLSNLLSVSIAGIASYMTIMEAKRSTLGQGGIEL